MNYPGDIYIISTGSVVGPWKTNSGTSLGQVRWSRHRYGVYLVPVLYTRGLSMHGVILLVALKGCMNIAVYGGARLYNVDRDTCRDVFGAPLPNDPNDCNTIPT